MTFDNRLFTPIAIFRDNVVLDTVQAEEVRTFPINRKGVIRHAWKIVPPKGVLGRAAGIEPYVDLGIQYAIDARYTITRSSVPGETIFTPLIANFSSYDLQLYANYGVDDEFQSDYVLPRGGIMPTDHAPYYYWNSNSNIYLDRIGGVGYYTFSRSDTGIYELRLDDSPRYGDAGATIPITVR